MVAYFRGWVESDVHWGLTDLAFERPMAVSTCELGLTRRRRAREASSSGYQPLHDAAVTASSAVGGPKLGRTVGLGHVFEGGLVLVVVFFHWLQADTKGTFHLLKSIFYFPVWVLSKCKKPP